MTIGEGERTVYVAHCRDDECDGGDDLPVEGLDPWGPFLLGKYHEDQTGHEIGYATHYLDPEVEDRQ